MILRPPCKCDAQEQFLRAVSEMTTANLHFSKHTKAVYFNYSYNNQNIFSPLAFCFLLHYCSITEYKIIYLYINVMT